MPRGVPKRQVCRRGRRLHALPHLVRVVLRLRGIGVHRMRRGLRARLVHQPLHAHLRPRRVLRRIRPRDDVVPDVHVERDGELHKHDVCRQVCREPVDPAREGDRQLPAPGLAPHLLQRAAQSDANDVHQPRGDAPRLVRERRLCLDRPAGRLRDAAHHRMRLEPVCAGRVRALRRRLRDLQRRRDQLHELRGRAVPHGQRLRRGVPAGPLCRPELACSRLPHLPLLLRALQWANAHRLPLVQRR